MSSSDDQKPTFGDKKVPLWIKVMWVLGLTWMVGYLILGMSSSPTSW